MNRNDFIFHDRLGSRWRRIKFGAVVGFLCAAAVVSYFVHELVVLPHLAKARVSSGVSKIDQGKPIDLTRLPVPLAPPDWLHAKQGVRPATVRRKTAAAHAHITLGFYDTEDDRSLISFSEHASSLTHVAPDLLFVSGFGGNLRVKDAPELIEGAQRAQVKIVPVLANYADEAWQPETIEELGADRTVRHAFFAKLLDALNEFGASGVMVDWQLLDPARTAEVTDLLLDLAQRLHERELELWLSMPVGNDIKVFDLDALAPAIDRFVPTLFYENGEDDTPGPIASLEWWQTWWRVLLEHGSPDQWIPALGAFGYDWPAERRAEMLAFTDVMARAGLARQAEISADAPLYQPNFAYTENGTDHVVWFLDAVTVRNQLELAMKSGAGGVALYRLGLEDPAVWKLLDHEQIGPEALERLRTESIAHVGSGDLLSPVVGAEEGKRSIRAGSDGLWQERYEQYPAPALLMHAGESDSDRVALTFDDGPDPESTPQILEILRGKGVKAAFFVLGSRALEHPDLLRQIAQEGHEIGNHTYWHPNLSETPSGWVKMELNATRSVIESITGASTSLFRPPYNADRFPLARAEFDTIRLARDAGYLTVNSSIDGEDWNAADADQIVERIKGRRPEGNVVLLHDGGGDRTATVEALPQVIDWLRLRGDQIVPLAELLNVPRAELMPPLPAAPPSANRTLVQAGLQTIEDAQDLVWLALTGVTLLLLLRSMVLVVLAVAAERKGRWALRQLKEAPPVSVIIAAYNEARVIGPTLEALALADYPGKLQVIVVDDGSIDGTREIVSGLRGRFEQLELITQENSGKASALNKGLALAAHEQIVTLDADTLFEKQTISKLVEALVQPNVGAVSGHIRVLNESGALLCRLQSLEYIAGFNLERRAYEHWNCITVVPGACAAFRRSALIALGGFSNDTVAEDTDVTLALHRHGFSVRFSPGAAAWTEAPDTVSGFMRQRARWAFGTLQCLWKHRSILFHPRYRALAYFSLPSVWLCHFLLVLVSPMLDLMLAGSLVWGFSPVVAAYAAVFLVVDLALGATACVLAGEPTRKALLAIPARVVYRPLLALAVWLAVVRALRGAWVGWGRVERRGVLPVEVFGAPSESGVL